MQYRSFADLDILLRNNLHKIPRDIDIIIGIPRSGLLVANMLSLTLNKPLTDLEGLFEHRIIAHGKSKNQKTESNFSNFQKIIIAEDSVNTGLSIIECKKRIEQSEYKGKCLFLSAYVKPGMEALVDIWFEKIDIPRLFEWNLFHHMIIENACIDIDGVICVDPTDEENDDGERYLNFLRNATPLFIPTRKVGYLVSSRLEKYRSVIEEWLANNNIQYNKLILLDSTAEDRREKKLHASFKADIYRKCNAELFIESDNSQAVQISQITRKPVYCVNNNAFYDGSITYNLTSKSKKTIKNRLKKIPFIYKIGKKIKNRR